MRSMQHDDMRPSKQGRGILRLDSNSIGQTDRFFCLDAMRGVAAIAVVLLHMNSFSGENFAPGGDLAVDFFFALSGFVIARAYRERLLSGLSIAEFCKIRVIRLYPLFILGVGLGIFKEVGKIVLHLPNASSWGSLIEMVLTNGLLLPTPDQQFLFPLNNPDWSLFLEIIVNLIYAVLLVRLPLRWLVAACFISACAVIWGSITVGNISLGPDWATLHYGFSRIGYSFILGAILAHFWNQPMRRATYLAALPVIALIFFLTVHMPANIRIFYNPIIAIFVLPMTLWVGSVWEIPRPFRRTCAFLGDISYPLYATHFPLLVIFARVQQRFLNFHIATTVSILFLLCMLVLSTLLVSFYDAPLRACIGGALKLRRSAPPQVIKADGYLWR